MSSPADAIQIIENDAFVGLTRHLGLDPPAFLQLLSQAAQVEDRSLNSRTNELTPLHLVALMAATIFEKLVREVAEKINIMLGSPPAAPTPRKTSTVIPSANSFDTLPLSLSLVEAPSFAISDGAASLAFDDLHINYLNERLILNFVESLSTAERVP